MPIATLLMVAEMTGGYQLLVPAGLAVMLSFLIQINLSSFLKYGSLYEAQVAARADSPAHRAENIRIALRLLDQGKVTLPPQMNHLHLAALLQSGLSLDLPDGSQLVTGALRPESPWVGKQIQARVLSAPLADAKLVAVLRGKSVMMARPETVLQPGDILLLIASPQAQEELQKHLVPARAQDPHVSRKPITVRQRLRRRASGNLTQGIVTACALLRRRTNSNCTPRSPPPRNPHGGAHRSGGLSRVSLRIRRILVRRGPPARKAPWEDRLLRCRRGASR